MCWLICTFIMGVLSTIFEISASSSDMSHFQRAMKLDLYQLAVNCDGEKTVSPIITKSLYELIRGAICPVMLYLSISLSTEYHLTDSSATYGVLPPVICAIF
jgi:hypothetical protein